MTVPTSARRASLVVLFGIAMIAGCSGPQNTGLRDHDGASRLRVAQAAEDSGQTDVALSLYAAAAAAEPDRADVQARLASALSHSGNTVQAEQVLSRAIGRRPDNPILLAQMGRLRLQTGAAEQAQEIFGRLIAVAPRNAEAWDLQGVAFDLLGRHPEAERSYRQALAFAPDNIAAANNLALSLLLVGRALEALVILEPLAMRASTQSRVAANLLVARSAAGNSGAASTTVNQVGGAEDLQAILRSLAAGTAAGAAGQL